MTAFQDGFAQNALPHPEHLCTSVYSLVRESEAFTVAIRSSFEAGAGLCDKGTGQPWGLVSTDTRAHQAPIFDAEIAHSLCQNESHG